MERESINEIISCLPSGETRFYYAPERSTCDLLRYHIGHSMAISELKRSAFAKLLQRPVMKQIVAGCGDGRIHSQQLAWTPEHSYLFLLSLDSYGEDEGQYVRFSQLIRRGHNLVLQINLSCEHDIYYQELIQCHRQKPFAYLSHPVHQDYNSLAWTRLDIDLDTGEAFIEEIQSDFVRLVARVAKGYTKEKDGWLYRYSEYNECLGLYHNVKHYIEHVAAPYLQHWQDVSMLATIWFLKEELGIHDIYMHNHQTVNKVKECEAPRSLYHDLPKRFCFQQSKAVPTFLRQSTSPKTRKVINKHGLWRLRF